MLFLALKLKEIARAALIGVLSLPVYGYRLFVSPFMAANCRFQPTCSAYALEALATQGPVKGGWLAIRRIGKCHPWGRQGFDPVPRLPKKH